MSVKNFHPERSSGRGLQKNQRALEELLEQLFERASGDELFVVLAGRSGGQTILQGVTLEGGVVVNDLGADVDFRAEGNTEPNLLFVDASTDRVGIGTASPANRLHVSESNAGEAVIAQFVNAGGGGTQFRLVTTGRTWALRQTSIGLSFRDVTGAAEPLILAQGAPGNSIRAEVGGVAFLGAGSFGGGVGVLFIGNRTTAPTSNPAGGLLLWAESGAPRARTSAGLIGEMLYKSSSAADPTTTELPASGDAGIHKNTTSGAVFLAYNDGGTIKKVALT